MHLGLYLGVQLIAVSAYNKSWNDCEDLVVYCLIKCHLFHHVCYVWRVGY